MLRSPTGSPGLLHRLGIVLLCLSLALPTAQGKSKAKAKAETTSEVTTAPAEEKAAPSPATDSPPPTAAAASQPAPASTSPPSDTGVGSLPKGKLSKAEIDAAKALASSAFQVGKYSDAAEILLRVYESDPQPLYLFNAGQSYRKGDKPREAKAAYEKFLQAAPEHRLAPEVVGYIRDMDTILATQKKTQEISIELDKEKAEAQWARQALQQERAPLYKKPLFWATVAGGVVVVATIGLVVLAIQSQGFSDLGNRRVK